MMPGSSSGTRCLVRLSAFLIAFGFCLQVHAQDALVAVAANFSDVMAELKREFENTSDLRVRYTTGSTGVLYAQIIHGAPFDILLAADQRRPRLLEDEGVAIVGSRFTYAVGQLTLWTPREAFDLTDIRAALRNDGVRKIAMANPKVAPYGTAAMQTLASLGLDQALAGKVVMGENIGQTHALVATGNADIGFLALSYVQSPKNVMPGSRWDVPRDLYDPIRQDAVLMRRATDNPAANAFLRFLSSPAARTIIAQYGYAIDDASFPAR